MSTKTNVPTNPVLIDLPMPITTPRLLLRPVTAGDGAAMHACKQETMDQLLEWMIWAETPTTPEDDEITVRKAQTRLILREDIWIVGIEKVGNRPVIFTGLHRPDWIARTFEIGYWVRKSAQDKGYATESTQALLLYAFNVLAARRVAITHAAGNDASRRVIEKLGFVPEGIMQQDTTLPGGRFADRHVYARMSTDNLPPLDVRWGIS